MSQAPAPGPAAAHDICHSRQRPLGAFFAPATVAVIGATEKPGSVGRTLVANLLQAPFPGEVFPVNPKRQQVLGLPAYPHIAAVPRPVDLALIVTPAATVPGLVAECAAAGVRAAVIISAGFKEVGGAGADLERQVRDQLRGRRMRVLGPNCLGVMCPHTALNATFAAGMARPGNVAFLSQSGALLTAILDWGLLHSVGFSAIVSTGSMLDVNWGDLIDYLGDDPHTQSILVYMESIGDARAFLSAARQVTLRKPVIVLKAGRTEAAARAAASHTGALSGSDAVLEAAFRRCGALRVHRIADLFHLAGVLARQPRPRGPRLTILTNAGGPGVLATDTLIGLGGQLAPLAPATRQALDDLLPPQWSHGNPIDILGDADPQRYAAAVAVAARDPDSDGLLVVLTPQDMTDPTQTAEQLRPFAHLPDRPILASWMGGATVAAGVDILNRAGIPTFDFPDTAARVFDAMWRYTDNLRGLYETPLPPTEEPGTADQARAAELVRAVRQRGRTLFTEAEAKRLLACYHIPTVPTHVAATADEAVRLAEQVGFPVVLKLLSETITHKTDVGGVLLNLPDADAVRRGFRQIEAAVADRAGPGHFAGVTVQPFVRFDGYELILGSSIDPQFGPVVLFGTGGQLVEVFRDSALALPPLNTTLARRLIEQTRIGTALKGVRGRKPVDLPALEQLLARFSQLVVDHPRIAEIDINPLLAAPTGLLALDARVVLHPPETADDRLPRPAVRPYPARYVSTWLAPDGVPITLRPVRPDDEPLVARFHQTLSEQTVYQRYLHAMKLSQRVAHERLARLCFIDYDREIALVAERRDPQTGEPSIVAIGRLIKSPAAPEAQFALMVTDAYQRRGLGTELLRQLLQVARSEGVRRVTADILPSNIGMQRLCQNLGFRLSLPLERDALVFAELRLDPA